MLRSETASEPRWHAALATVAALLLYVTLPPKVIVGPFWLMPLLVLLILVPLLILAPRRDELEHPWQRFASVASIAVLNLFNLCTIGLFFFYELSGAHRREFNGGGLLEIAVQLWLTNIIVFALWFWEVDGGGPGARTQTDFMSNPERADFLFPQMALTGEVSRLLRWKPQFIDYLFLAFTNATAFSPTDTFALSPMAKVLMMAQAIISLVTVAIVVGRAVNILSG